MLKRNSAATSVRSEFNDRRAALLRRFGREEDGSIIVMTILLLVIGGMAVDFMRFESRRALLQSVADRAVLAAADLDQPMDQKAVVTVYFQKAGFDGAIQGQPIVDDNSGNVLVSANSSLDIDTFYLRFIGIDQLTASASSEAREGVGQLEVSFVLDISGSMDQIVSGATLPTPSARSRPAPVGSGYHNATNLARVSRIKLLREAACGFVYDPIPSETAGQVTLLLVVYTSQVALSGEFYDALRTTDPLVGIGGTAAEIPETEEEITAALSAATLWRNPSRCVEFEDSDYKGGRAPRTEGQTDGEEEFGTTLYATKTYTQTRSFQYNVGGLYDRGGVEDNTSGTTRSTKVDGQMCPTEEFEGLLLISEDELRRRISLLEPRGGTAIFTGAKWGISLLDPSMRPVIQNVDTVAAIHRETRPLDYPDATAEAEAKAPSYKFMVLMTDSQKSNVAGNSPRYDEGSEMRRLFDSDPTHHLTWTRNRSDDRLTSSQRQFKYYLRELAPHGPSNADPFSGGGAFFNVINTNVQDETEADRLSKGMYRTAKARDIVVYANAAGATSNGETPMNCFASELKGIYYKQTSGADLDNIHAAVAEQLIDLRLTH